MQGSWKGSAAMPPEVHELKNLRTDHLDEVRLMQAMVREVASRHELLQGMQGIPARAPSSSSPSARVTPPVRACRASGATLAHGSDAKDADLFGEVFDDEDAAHEVAEGDSARSRASVPTPTGDDQRSRGRSRTPGRRAVEQPAAKARVTPGSRSGIDKAFDKLCQKTQSLVSFFTDPSWIKVLRGKEKKCTNLIAAWQAFLKECKKCEREDLIADAEAAIEVVESTATIVRNARAGATDADFLDPDVHLAKVQQVAAYIDEIGLSENRNMMLAPNLMRIKVVAMEHPAAPLRVLFPRLPAPTPLCIITHCRHRLAPSVLPLVGDVVVFGDSSSGGSNNMFMFGKFSRCDGWSSASNPRCKASS